MDRVQMAFRRDQTEPGYTAGVKAEARWFGALQDRFGLPDRVEVVDPRPLPTTPYPITLARALAAGPEPTPVERADEVWVLPLYRLPLAGRIRIDDEVIAYRRSNSDSGLNAGISTLSETTRGWGGTVVAPHGEGATITSLDDQQHWDYDDAYWVYGQGPTEVWVRVSDGSVWQAGGTTPGSVPTISGVQVSPSGTSATVSWTTDRPASGWVEYDTYGRAEEHHGRRPAEWWPNYLHKTNLEDEGAPAVGTTHRRTLTGLTAGATYHYRIVVRGPAQAVTPDATFVAGGTGG
jgi:hypothetical protein